MTIEEAVATKLKAVLGHSRVFPDAIPDTNVNDNQWPCLVYTHQSDDEQHGLNATTAAKDHEDTYTLTLWGPDRLAILTARNTLKAAFAGYNAAGVWGGSGGLVVAGATAMNASATVQPAEDGSDRHMRAEILTLKVFWYN